MSFQNFIKGFEVGWIKSCGFGSGSQSNIKMSHQGIQVLKSNLEIRQILHKMSNFVKRKHQSHHMRFCIPLYPCVFCYFTWKSYLKPSCIIQMFERKYRIQNSSTKKPFINIEQGILSHFRFILHSKNVLSPEHIA